MLIKPSDIYNTAQDVVTFIARDDIADHDKKVILEMCRDFYQDRNEHIVDQWLTQFLQRTIDKKYPPTGLE